MRPEPLDRTLDRIIGYAESLRGKMFDLRCHLAEEAARVTGWTTRTDEPAVHRSGHSSTTEAQAIRREDLAETDRYLTGCIDAAALTLRNAIRDANAELGHRRPDPEPTPRCDGGAGYTGYLIPRDEGGWADQDCTNIPDEGRTTCAACRQRASRWKRQREAGVA